MSPETLEIRAIPKKSLEFNAVCIKILISDLSILATCLMLTADKL